MGTTIRNEISNKNPYKLNKHRYLELKHFCLQYPDWKKLYLSENGIRSGGFELHGRRRTEWGDPTAIGAMFKADCDRNIRMIEETARETDSFLFPYILVAVTEGYGFTYLKMMMNIPCGKDLYYQLYRKFFWLLDKRK